MYTYTIPKFKGSSYGAVREIYVSYNEVLKGKIGLIGVRIRDSAARAVEKGDGTIRDEEKERDLAARYNLYFMVEEASSSLT